MRVHSCQYMRQRVGLARYVQLTLERGEAMFENRIHVPLSRDMCERMCRVEVFLEHLGLKCDVESISHIALSTLWQVLQDHDRGHYVRRIIGGSQISVCDPDIPDRCVGRASETWVILNPSPKLITLAKKIAIRADAEDDLGFGLHWALYYFSQIVDCFNSGGDLATRQLMDGTWYGPPQLWELSLFHRPPTAVIQ